MPRRRAGPPAALTSTHTEVAELCRDEARSALPPDSAVRASEPSVALRALSGHPWVMEPAGTASRRWATTVCRPAGFEPDVRFESPDLLVRLRLVEEGQAAALLPGLSWSGGASSVPLLNAHLKAASGPRDAYGCRRRIPSSPARPPCFQPFSACAHAGATGRPGAGRPWTA
ncbi:LysR substrate-binding domain-containing protein [Streptomyces halobius]|uniref:LysR substrate-binding domain-containing protein n=1 Tax=Streptomyces halobius TaxID=2879846 RepID=A0ABY4MJZ0_9ACTN|nr:LysR substrate-binding domain-containing protein [Streptomyces halobius]UQA98104.1 hypothetical protein K9S39_38030 [Streptomyces halobius]